MGGMVNLQGVLEHDEVLHGIVLSCIQKLIHLSNGGNESDGLVNRSASLNYDQGLKVQKAQISIDNMSRKKTKRKMGFAMKNKRFMSRRGWPFVYLQTKSFRYSCRDPSVEFV